MSDDITDRLRNASDDGGRPLGFRASSIIHAGRARRRRRRALGSSSVAFGVAGIVVASMALWPTPSPDPDRSDDAPVADQNDPDAGVYDPTPLAKREVLRRCSERLARHWNDLYSEVTDWSWPTEPGSNAYATWTVGSSVGLKPAGTGPRAVGASCTIPERGLQSQPPYYKGPIASADDEDAIREQCGAIAGYDFTGWDVVVAAASPVKPDRLVAVLRSANNHPATCFVDRNLFYQSVAISPSPYRVGDNRRDYDYPTDVFFVQPSNAADRKGVVFSYAGRLPHGKGADRVPNQVKALRLHLPDGTSQTVEVRDGAYAFQAYSKRYGRVQVAFLDASGRVLDKVWADRTGP